MTQTANPKPESHPTNRELLLWALYLAGGADRWTDVEEVYLKAFELAPARLSWRTRADLPDYKKCAKALQELEATESPYRELLSRKNRYERKLTIAGSDWCELHRDTLASKYSDRIVPSAPIQTTARRLRDVERSDLYQRWVDSGRVDAHHWEILEMLRCMPDAPPQLWSARCDEIQLSARRDGHNDIQRFIEQVRAALSAEESP
jgi:hypothetical protein